MSESAGLYIHVPFCRSKCAYCDFYSLPLLEQKEAYLRALAEELKEEPSYLDCQALSSIYFGGGTPSLLNAEDFHYLFDLIQAHYDLRDCGEITIEANPDDLNMTYIKSLSRLPFNRISIGIQSFCDESLRSIHRRHNARQAIEAVRNCRTQGFDNISIDLMFGLPNQTADIFHQDLQQAIELQVEHLSVYLLSLEPGVPLYRQWKKGHWRAMDEQESERLYYSAHEKLSQAGYEHYELSNFAKPGFRAKHNAAYWQGKPYLGIGPSAHSFNGKSRRWNPSDLKAYIQSGGHPLREEETLNENDRYNDFILTRLRTAEGFKTADIECCFGKSKTDFCLRSAQKWLRRGALRMEEGNLRIAPSAYFISDSIIRDLFYV